MRDVSGGFCKIFACMVCALYCWSHCTAMDGMVSILQTARTRALRGLGSWHKDLMLPTLSFIWNVWRCLHRMYIFVELCNIETWWHYQKRLKAFLVAHQFSHMPGGHFRCAWHDPIKPEKHWPVQPALSVWRARLYCMCFTVHKPIKYLRPQ